MYFILRFIVIKVEILQNKMSTKALKLLNFVETRRKWGIMKKSYMQSFVLFCSNLYMASLHFLDVRSYVNAHNDLLINVVFVSLNTCFST